MLRWDGAMRWDWGESGPVDTYGKKPLLFLQFSKEWKRFLIFFGNII